MVVGAELGPAFVWWVSARRADSGAGHSKSCVSSASLNQGSEGTAPSKYQVKIKVMGRLGLASLLKYSAQGSMERKTEGNE